MLAKGVIKLEATEMVAPSLLILKIDGVIRLCVKYRKRKP